MITPEVALVESTSTQYGSVNAQVTFDRILHADKEPQNWLTYSGTTLGQRYSPLKQITPDNVKESHHAVGLPGAQHRKV